VDDGPYRTAGDNGDVPKDCWRCPKCRRVFHVLANARLLAGAHVCMDCYRKERPNGL
jgi:hypothetical protein